MGQNVQLIRTQRTQLYWQSSVKLLISKKRLEKILEFSLIEFEKFLRAELGIKSKEYQINLMICGKTKMRRINHEFRAKDKPTDVLTFPMEEKLYKMKSLPEYLTQLLNLGDIVICHDVLKKQACEFGVTVAEEFVRLFVHGLLHITDLDHERSKIEHDYMFKHQEKIIKKVLRNL